MNIHELSNFASNIEEKFKAVNKNEVKLVKEFGIINHSELLNFLNSLRRNQTKEFELYVRGLDKSRKVIYIILHGHNFNNKANKLIMLGNTEDVNKQLNTCINSFSLF